MQRLYSPSSTVATFLLMGCLAIAGCQQGPAVPGDADLADRPIVADEPAESATDSEPAADDSRHGAGSSKPKHSNRLAQETSPYLLMHAHNPVDWYGWGEVALAKARRENKVIFLSIGYSSCYWCHVMERESFMDDEIAAFLNQHFVCIKVDREERPDVDDIYMTAVQLMTRGGGWPLTAFLTPDARPFAGGTYFPARTGDRGQQIGFLDLLRNVQRAWRDDSDSLKLQADRVATAVRHVLRERTVQETALDRTLCDRVQASMAEQFDPEYGGFGYTELDAQRPKFPSPPDLIFLADRVRQNKEDAKARQMLELTLDKMAQGGIRDHLGGGFHRYSTDRYWLIPHFEKMLYDNGQLATLYAEAFALTGHQRYRRVVIELLEYIQREMTDSAGGFYAAIDAETDAEEGKFYRWTRGELDQALGEVDTDLFYRAYGVAGGPNFEHKDSVLHLPHPLRQLAAAAKLPEAELDEKLAPLRATLLATRDQRKRPLTDTKILTAWNGLMIRGFADAGRVLDNAEYTATAAKAADFVLDKLRTDEGRLLRTYRQGSAKLNAYLDDYAFLVDGLIALHRATGEARWLDAAVQLTDKQIELFWDDEAGGFFYTSDDHETLIARAVKQTDSVLPSGNAVSAANLVYLAGALPDDPSRQKYRQRARQTLAAFAPGLADDRQARHMPAMAVALAAFLDAR
ncbi:MAG: thioredoxin domain-containing protein [Planctomycetota bacterium]|nr:thioredoxin domain-containing protein [Planctomycetota bacterium]